MKKGIDDSRLAQNADSLKKLIHIGMAFSQPTIENGIGKLMNMDTFKLPFKRLAASGSEEHHGIFRLVGLLKNIGVC
jgi:hypothetical protein